MQGAALPSDSTVHFVLDLAPRIDEVQLSSARRTRTPRWLATLAYAGIAAAIAILIGGDWLVAVSAAGITALIDRVARLLNRPTVMVAAAITVLLSGLSVVSTVQDAITGYNITAAGRTVEVSLMTVGLIAGVVLALNIAVRWAWCCGAGARSPPLAWCSASTSPSRSATDSAAWSAGSPAHEWLVRCGRRAAGWSEPCVTAHVPSPTRAVRRLISEFDAFRGRHARREHRGGQQWWGRFHRRGEQVAG